MEPATGVNSSSTAAASAASPASPPLPFHHHAPQPPPSTATQPAAAWWSRLISQRSDGIPAPKGRPSSPAFVPSPSTPFDSYAHSTPSTPSSPSPPLPPSPDGAPPASPPSPPSLPRPSSLPFSSTLSELLQRNPVFSGGAGLALVGVAAAAGREAARGCLRLTRKYLTVSLEIPSKDRSYQWVLQWLSRQQQSAAANVSSTSSPPSLLARWASAFSRQQHLGVETSFTQSPSGVVSTHFDFVPSPGEHAFWYRQRLVYYTRTREKAVVDLQTGSPWETVTLRTFGRSQQLMLDLLNEAKAAALRRTENRTVVYTSSGIDWRPFGQPRKKRPLDSVVLDQGVAERLLDDFRTFLASQAWYVDRGIPYRRGYLLHGPPGCGKSSFIQAMSGSLQYNICVLNLNERSLTDDKLAYLLATLPPRSLLLLEDVDAAFQQRDARAATLTFSGLLNALDGVASTEERVICMTTNHIDRLDPALIRPGRVDVQVYVGMASEWQRREMWRRFYEGQEGWRELGEAFVQRMQEVELSVAELQGFFLLHKTQPHAALQACEQWKQSKVEESRRQASTERERRRQMQMHNAAADAEPLARTPSASPPAAATPP